MLSRNYEPHTSNFLLLYRETGNILKQIHSKEGKNWRESGNFNWCSSDPESCLHIAKEIHLNSECQQDQQLQSLSDLVTPDNLYFDVGSLPLTTSQEEIGEESSPTTLPSSSLKILQNFRNRIRRLDGVKINVPWLNKACSYEDGWSSSSNNIIRLAGEKFIQSRSKGIDDHSVPSHLFRTSFLGLSDEEARDVRLVQCLLVAAENVGLQQFKRASKLLDQCNGMSYDRGNPIQRLVHYFSEALQERIDRKTGRITSKGLGNILNTDIEADAMDPSPGILAYLQHVPFCQVGQLTAAQTIVEHVVDAKRVHIIDLRINCGIHCTVWMQALVDRCNCPLEHLKITAVATKSRVQIEKTGKRLMCFAESMNIPFSFKVVFVANIVDLDIGLFQLDADEAVVVYSPYSLRTLITWPNQLDSFLRTIRKINPCVMVVTEVEGNHNSPAYVNRFTEALFFFGAFFDCLEDCMSHDEQNRWIIESRYFSHGIRNMVAAEGEERTIRHVGLDVWRAFFSRFGMVETELSMSSIYQTSLVLDKFSCGSSCTLDTDGKGLIVGWKRTPIFSLSAWKFLQDN